MVAWETVVISESNEGDEVNEVQRLMGAIYMSCVGSHRLRSTFGELF